MMRSTGSITVAFGLVSIPVKLYAATSQADAIKFCLLDKQGGRVEQQYVNEAGEAVAYSDMLRGYEFAAGQFVTFTPDELKAMKEAGTKTAEVVEFVPADSIDPIYFGKPYFLAPDKVGATAYTLFAEALRASGRVAIAKWAANGKQKVVMIRATDAGLVMQLLMFADEVRSMSELAIPRVDVKPAELALAKQLIDALSTEAFDPSTVTDVVGQRIREAVQKKVEGHEFTIAEAPSGAQVIDLQAALLASVQKRVARDAKAAPVASVASAAPAPARKRAVRKSA
jgi:DNA end-binding protein Ku